MALAFPLALDEFFALLPISSISLDMPENVQMDMTGGGEILTDDLSPQLWTGDVTLARMLAAEMDHASVMIDLLRPSGRLFWAYDTRRPGPLADPKGFILGAATPVIASLPAGNRTLSISGLPVGYQLSRGDYLAFSYDSGRRSLCRVVPPTVVANGGGVTPAFEVGRIIDPGVVVGTAVHLLRPAIPVRLVPGSVSKGTTRNQITDGFSFKFQQTLARIT